MKVLCLGVLFALCSLVAGHLVAKEITSASSRLGPYSQQFSLVQDKTNEDLDLPGVRQSASEALVTEIIWNALERFRDAVIAAEGLPQMDPIVIDSVGPYEFETSSGSQAQVTFKDFRAEGLGRFELDSVTMSPLRRTAGILLTLPSLLMTADYDAQVRVSLMTQYASGKVRFVMNRFDVGLGAKLGASLNGGHLVLRDLNVDLYVHDIYIEIDEMTGSSFINTLISTYVANFTHETVQEQLTTFGEILGDILLEVFNDILMKFTIADVIELYRKHY